MGLSWIPKLVVLEPDQCLAMLATEEVGRVVVPGWFPLTSPVSYVMDDETVVLYVDGSGPVARALGREIWFSVDHYDREARGGWRVVVQGELDQPRLDVALSDEASSTGVARRRLRRRLRPRRVIGHLLFDPLYPSYRSGPPWSEIDTDVEDGRVDLEVPTVAPPGSRPTGAPSGIAPAPARAASGPSRARRASLPGRFPRPPAGKRPRGLRLISSADTGRR